MAPAREDKFGFGIGAWAFGLAALVFGFLALVVAGQALARSDDAKAEARKSGGTKVTLADFSIDPETISAPVDGTLTVTNNGSSVHNLVVADHDNKTKDLQSGQTGTMSLSGLKAGSYEVFCSIAGHKEQGMVATLEVGGGGGDAGMEGMDHGERAGVNTEANDAQDALMKKPVDAYVAQLEEGANTEGVGNQPLPPKLVTENGTTFKVFEVTAAITDWEVEPGKTVKAWTYNGTVPGPWIRVEPGDNVRVVLKNDLPQSTAIHFHGIETPNAMDGVPDVTQPPVKPGETFTYEFVAKGPALGMYHSHHHAEHQVPDGLLGVFQVGDQPNPPDGSPVAQEVPMVLNDAGVVGLTLNGKSFPATAPIIAKQGEWVKIHYANEGLQIHPMHLHGLPQLVVSKDGFALPQPYTVDTLNVAPGERYTVLVKATELGVWAYHCHILTHAERDDGMFGMVTTFIVQ